MINDLIVWGRMNALTSHLDSYVEEQILPLLSFGRCWFWRYPRSCPDRCPQRIRTYTALMHGWQVCWSHQTCRICNVSNYLAHMACSKFNWHLHMFLNRITTYIAISQITREKKASSFLLLNRSLGCFRIGLFWWQVNDCHVCTLPGHQNGHRSPNSRARRNPQTVSKRNVFQFSYILSTSDEGLLALQFAWANVFEKAAQSFQLSRFTRFCHYALQSTRLL